MRKKRDRNSGIYRIRNIINNHSYIGQAKDFKERNTYHFYQLKKNIHFNDYLQHAFNKYGEENFVFEILLICDIENLTYYEQLLVDNFNPEYNIRRICVNSNVGVKRTELQNKRNSETHKGKRLSEETKIKISIAVKGENNPNFGNFWSDEQKKSLSEKNKGENAPNYGKTFSEETRRKMSENHFDNSGENHAGYGKPRTDEVKKKIAYFHRGRKIGGTSKYIGVSWHKASNRWTSQFTYNGKKIYVGIFKTEEEAALAYNKKAIELYGSEAKINIIDEVIYDNNSN